MNEKNRLRIKVGEILTGLSEGDIASDDEAIYHNLVSLKEFSDAKAVFAYCSVGREPDTRRIIAKALSDGKTVALPYITGEGTMSARVLRSVSELVPGKFDIPSPPAASEELRPCDMDFILVPALAFDVNGYRLGRGGGYYDRYLAETTAFAAGLSREASLLLQVPREAHDLPVQCIVTEMRIVRLTPGAQEQRF